MEIRVWGYRDIIVRFEPSGAEYPLAQGRYFVIDWPVDGQSPVGGVVWDEDGLVVSEPGGGLAHRIWDSDGNEVSVIG
ncbi:hypothetical protein [Actinokineospora xionganensis]|uniref:Uncharacterized protein n=1 Tax=Actinokineospora xionganensis TaxID=2684470 RepID=A0ABR7LGA5_9PSEU|nr:hypothetical protein [Actinokineospora xionganensis]MBC6451725.1 hypothetical protein [Actinokineospora xionganensis]